MAVPRRKRPSAAGTLPTPPDHLRHLFVEDWVRPDEEQPAWSLPGTWHEWAYLEARTRWRRAANEWLSAHDIPHKRWCEVIPGQRPRWRQEPPADPR
ncbi:hypothetical protein [Streptomyces sp. UG1]|uniref:hypothetical protein n=1 Tax=Streptomyces sp. UG1 TaxID=3417652 RepID=UPI003CF6B32A